MSTRTLEAIEKLRQRAMQGGTFGAADVLILFAVLDDLKAEALRWRRVAENSADVVRSARRAVASMLSKLES